MCHHSLPITPKRFSRYLKTTRFRSDRITATTPLAVIVVVASVNGGGASCRERVGRKNATGAGAAEEGGAERQARGSGTNGSERRTSERERKDSVRSGVWVEARTGTRTGSAGVSGHRDEETGTGTRERRNTNRLDVDGGVGVGPDMAEASRLPEVAKEMKCLPAGEATLYTPGEFLPSSSPPPPSRRNRRSSPGFPEFSSFHETWKARG